MTAAPCPDDNQLTRFALGSLSEADAEAVSAHLDDCPSCLTAVAAVAAPEAPAASARAPAPGTRVGPYVVERLLGRGGMGAVYVARDEALDRRVALKVVSDVRDDRARARLAREAQAMARLTHPHVVTVYALVEWEGQPCIAMELVAGPTLASWRAQSPRTAREVVSVLRDAGRGLAAAHQVGLVHRDFKPSNVLVGLDGRTRVSDFGLARADVEPAEVGEVGDDDVLRTRTGAVLGTPAYMAPEQLRGQGADERSDQFSFCVTLVEALTGRRPYSGATLEGLKGALQQPPALAGVPAAVLPVVRRGLAVDPAARFEAMPALLDALERALPSLDAGRRRRPRLVWVALVVAMLGATLALRASRSTPPAPALTQPPAVAAPPEPAPPAATVSASVPKPGTYEVHAGELRLLWAPGATEVAVDDDSLAAAELTGPDQVMLRGLKPGATALRVWRGRAPSRYPLKVLAP